MPSHRPRLSTLGSLKTVVQPSDDLDLVEEDRDRDNSARGVTQKQTVRLQLDPGVVTELSAESIRLTSLSGETLTMTT